MAAKQPTQHLPFQCPAPLCGKGFQNLLQICKHVAMLARCGLFIQKVIDTQSQPFNKSLATLMPSMAKTNF